MEREVFLQSKGGLVKKEDCRPLREAAELCGMSPDVIIRFITFEWLAPVDPENQFLDEEDMARARLIWQLQNDFGVNDEAVSIILHLVDQLNRTRNEIEKGIPR